MKKTFIVIFSTVVMILLCSVFAYSQQDVVNAKIIFVEGEVHIKTPTDKQWITAAEDMFLPQGTKIKTGNNSSCEIVLDKEFINVIGLEQNTTVNIDSLYPAKINLPKGRVFAFIKELEEGSTFEIRTPTAIGGARGTGWLTEFDGNTTVFKQFDNALYFFCENMLGKSKDETELPSGFAIKIGSECDVGGLTKLTQIEIEEWETWSHEMMSHFAETVAEAYSPPESSKRLGPGNSSWGEGPPRETAASPVF